MVDRDSFVWLKRSGRGCGCSPRPENSEVYSLTIGRGAYTAVVKSKHSEEDSRITAWETEIFFGDYLYTGQSGGSDTRDEHMAWAESVIRGSIQQMLRAVSVPPGRRTIRDAYRPVDANGHFQPGRVLEEIHPCSKPQ